MTSSVLFAPHSDDEALFASYIIMREKPLVVIMTDGTSHVEKFGISIEQRRNETIEGMKLLGVSVVFIGFAEESLDQRNSFKLLCERLGDYTYEFDRCFTPALQGGHKHHDLVSKVCTQLWDLKCLYYSTYQKGSLEPVGELEVKPTEVEKLMKEAVLEKYASQIKINPHHFEAIKNKSEYLNLQPESWRA